MVHSAHLGFRLTRWRLHAHDYRIWPVDASSQCLRRLLQLLLVAYIPGEVDPEQREDEAPSGAD